jgi:integrase
MSSVYKTKDRGWYCVFTQPSGTRRSIYLGRISKKAADTIQTYVDRIIASNHVGLPPDQSVQEWLSLCDTKFRVKLLESGLIARWEGPKESPSLSSFWDAYLEKRIDFAVSSRKGFTTAKRHVIAFFGDRKISEISVGDAKQFALEMEHKHSSAHAKKIVERLKQVLQNAVDCKLLQENPFGRISVKARLNKTRGHYLPEAEALELLQHFGSAYGRAVFVLSRFAGLRVPHEPLALTWAHVDFQKHRITIPGNTKTGARVVPMVPIVYQAMLDLAELDTSSPWVFPSARASAATSFRKWLESSILLSGKSQWPKLWHNLRASCRTDWEEQFSSHVCDAWLGHSLRVAKDHYLQVTEEHWLKATGKCKLQIPRENSKHAAR